MSNARASRGDMEIELQEKGQRIGRTRRALRSIRAFIDRRLTTRAVVVVTVLLLAASWVYPPGFHYRNHSHCWFFLFDTDNVMRVDFGRLILLDAIFVAVGGGFAWAVSGNSPFRNMVIRLAFYSLVFAPAIALISGSAFLIRDVNRRADERTAAQAAKVARKNEEAAERASRVELEALKQVSLFEVQCWGTKLDPRVVIRVNGRVRNGLPIH